MSIYSMWLLGESSLRLQVVCNRNLCFGPKCDFRFKILRVDVRKSHRRLFSFIRAKFDCVPMLPTTSQRIFRSAIFPAHNKQELWRT